MSVTLIHSEGQRTEPQGCDGLNISGNNLCKVGSGRNLKSA